MASAVTEDHFSVKLMLDDAGKLILKGRLPDAVRQAVENLLFAKREHYQGATCFDIQVQLIGGEIYLNGKSLESLLHPKDPTTHPLHELYVAASDKNKHLFEAGLAKSTITPSPALDRDGNLDPNGRTHWVHLLIDAPDGKRQLSLQFIGSLQEFIVFCDSMGERLGVSSDPARGPFGGIASADKILSKEDILWAYSKALGPERFDNSPYGAEVKKHLYRAEKDREELQRLTDLLTRVILEWASRQDNPELAFLNLLRVLTSQRMMAQKEILGLLLNSDGIDQILHQNNSGQVRISDDRFITNSISDVLNLYESDELFQGATYSASFEELLVESIEVSGNNFNLDIDADNPSPHQTEEDDQLYPADEVEAVKFIYPDAADGPNEPNTDSEREEKAIFEAAFQTEPEFHEQLLQMREPILALDAIADFMEPEQTQDKSDLNQDAASAVDLIAESSPSTPTLRTAILDPEVELEVATLNSLAERSTANELFTLANDGLTDLGVQELSSLQASETELSLERQLQSDSAKMLEELVLADPASTSEDSYHNKLEKLLENIGDLSANELAEIVATALQSSLQAEETETALDGRTALDANEVIAALYSAHPELTLGLNEEAKLQLESYSELTSEPISLALQDSLTATTRTDELNTLQDSGPLNGLSLLTTETPAAAEETNQLEITSSEPLIMGGSAPKRHIRRAALRRRRVKLLELLRREALRRKMDFSFLMLDRRSLIKNDLYIEGLILGLVELLGLPEAQQARLFADFGVETQEIIRVRELLAAEEKLTEESEESITPESMPLTAVQAPEDEEYTNEPQQAVPAPEPHIDSELQTSRPASPYRSAPLA